MEIGKVEVLLLSFGNWFSIIFIGVVFCCEFILDCSFKFEVVEIVCIIFDIFDWFFIGRICEDCKVIC